MAKSREVGCLNNGKSKRGQLAKIRHRHGCNRNLATYGWAGAGTVATSLEVIERISVETTSVVHSIVQPAGSQVSDYLALLKPRVMSLVVFTGFAGLVVAPGGLHPLLAAVAVLCIAVGAGAAAAINMWYDRDIDALMERTRTRPVPAGRVAPATALAFGVTLSLFSVMLMGVAVNWTAAALLALANGLYVFVYTIWLKRRTPHNIVIGGAAGAFPPMIGWAAVTGGSVSSPSRCS